MSRMHSLPTVRSLVRSFGNPGQRNANRTTMAVWITVGGGLAFVVCVNFGGHFVGDTPSLSSPSVICPASCSSLILGRVPERVTCVVCICAPHLRMVVGSVAQSSGCCQLSPVVVGSIRLSLGLLCCFASALFFNEYSAHRCCAGSMAMAHDTFARAL